MHYNYQNPHYMYQQPQAHHGQYPSKQMVLRLTDPIAQYGLQEAQYTSYVHAFREVAAISYLMGRGYDAMTARQIVESWEMNETF